MGKEIRASSSTGVKFLAVIVMIFVILAAGYFFFMRNGKFSFGDFGVKESTTFTGEVLTSTVQSANELVTTTYRYKDAMPYNKDNKFSVLGKEVKFTSEEWLFVYEGEIKFGYDMSQVVIDLDNDKKTINVTLPEPKIIAHTTFDDKFHEYELKKSAFVEISPEEVLKEREALKKKQEELLLENKDFLKEFNTNTESALKELLNAATGNSGYDIVFL